MGGVCSGEECFKQWGGGAGRMLAAPHSSFSTAAAVPVPFSTSRNSCHTLHTLNNTGGEESGDCWGGACGWGENVGGQGGRGRGGAGSTP